MKKNLIALVLLITLFILPNLLFSRMTLAQEPGMTAPEPPPGSEICCGENSVLVTILKYLIWILVVVAAISIVIAGYYFVTAGGNPDTISKARNFVLYALIGVLIAVLARGLVWFVMKNIGGYTPQ